MGKQTPRELLAAIEVARRAGDYGTMTERAQQFFAELSWDKTAAADKIRSQASYQLAMGNFQQGKFDLAIQQALLSREEAHKAGDRAGELFARMVEFNTWYVQDENRKKEAFDGFNAIGIEADELLDTIDESKNSAEYGRVSRLVMNLTLHRSILVRGLEGPVSEVLYYLNKLGSNAAFKKAIAASAPWALDCRRDMATYIAAHS